MKRIKIRAVVQKGLQDEDKAFVFTDRGSPSFDRKREEFNSEMISFPKSQINVVCISDVAGKQKEVTLDVPLWLLSKKDINSPVWSKLITIIE